MRRQIHFPFKLVALIFSGLVMEVWGQTLPPRLLTKVHEIRALTPEQATGRIPVRLRGTVTTLSGYKDSFFLQDRTAGISVDRNDHDGASVTAGDLVEVEGVSGPGLFAPSVRASGVHVLSKGISPKAKVFRLSQLTGGIQDSQWIAIRGVVRAAEIRLIYQQRVLYLTIDTGEGLTSAHVLNYTGDYKRLVDAEVLLRGVCGTVFNSNRQYAGIRMFIPDLRQITVEKASRTGPFDCPLRPLNGLLQFGQDIVPFHRIRVRGTVIYQRPGKEIYLQQGNASLLVKTEASDHVTPGTVIEAAGFAGLGTYSPELQNVIFRIVGKGPVTDPLPVKTSELLEAKNSGLYIPHNGQLVRTKGQVAGLAETSDQHTILLSDEGAIFPVKLYKKSAKAVLSIAPGSLVQVTGICVAITNKTGDVESFQILARSPADLQVLASPPWWNVRHTLLILTLTGLLMLAAFAFIYRQRRRITKQKQALLWSARMLQRALDNVPLLALSLNQEGRVTDCNELLLKMLGLPAKQVIGLDWAQHFVAETCPPLDKPLVAPDFSSTLRVAHEDYIRSGDGSLRLVYWFNALLHNADGQAIGILALGEDISERKRAEEELSSAVAAANSASKAKSEFLANMSHEIRTPMNGILGMTGLVLQSELTADQRENLDMVRSSAESLLTIINDILDFSKVEAGKLALELIPFSLEGLLAETVTPLKVQANQKGIQLLWSLDPQAPAYLLGDPGRLRQVLLNLIGNALKFTTQGKISIFVRLQQSFADNSVELCFSVKDTGVGIPAAQQHKIFEAFSQADTSITRQFGGTGLGLSISSRLVHLFGGRIWVESEPGVGSTFYFTGKFSPAAAPVVVSPAISIRNAPVLFVDDNGNSLHAIQQAAAALSFSLTRVDSGEAALLAIEQSISEGSPYPLVILDLQRFGVDIFVVAEKIRSLVGSDKTKLIVLVLQGWCGDSARCLQLGIGGYLQKPVNPDDLRQAVVEVMGCGPGQAALVTRHSLRESRHRILLAEDNVVNQRLAVKLMEKQGHTVVVARNGQEAVEAIERETFDIILMDMQMPVMDGIEATMQIRHKEKQTGKRVKIFALTANAMAGDREKCLEAGMDGYLSKPIKAEELHAILV